MKVSVRYTKNEETCTFANDVGKDVMGIMERAVREFSCEAVVILLAYSLYREARGMNISINQSIINTLFVTFHQTNSSATTKKTSKPP